MTHPLDRPVWNSLHDRLARLAIGGGAAVGFERSCEAFVAGADSAPATLAAMAQLVPPGEQASMVERDPWPLPPGGTLVREARLIQMIADGGVEPPPAGLDPLKLGDADASEMLALATLCQPGPYFPNTHRLGGFVGKRDAAGRLVAMAGERFQIGRFTEISAVCTHPDTRGHGLARGLMQAVGSRIAARGRPPSCTPSRTMRARSDFTRASASGPGRRSATRSSAATRLGSKGRKGVVLPS